MEGGIDLAEVESQLVIKADPKQPVQEINNIISAFLRIWPGSEAEILIAVRAEIDRVLPQFEGVKTDATTDHVSGTSQQSSHGAIGSNQ